MSAPLDRLRGRKPVRWTTILGLVLVPLTVAGVLLWGLWNPTERLDTVTAAVVNQDEAVEIDGQLVPLGRVLAGELIAGDADTNFTWVLTDAEDAKAGLADGRFASSVTIPESFSAAATSAGDGPGAVKTARIEIAESDRGRLIDTALTSIVTQTATNVLNQQLGAQFVGNVFVGMTELHSGLGDAADGATQLADGGAKLATGTSELATGTSELASGAAELSTGAGSLASGAGALADGQAQLAAGVQAYTEGATQLADGYRPLGQGAVEAATQLKGLIAALTQASGALEGASADLEGGLTQIGIAAGTLGQQDIPTLQAQCAASGADPSFCETMVATLSARSGELQAGLAQVGTGASTLETELGGLAGLAGGAGGAPGGDPAAQLDALIGGLGQFGSGLDTFAAQGTQLASGAAQSADGASQLATGATQLAAGTSQLASGTSELATGTSQLADGAGKAADGQAELAKGLGEAVSGIPNYTEAEREKLSEHAVQTVKAEGASDELFNASGVPLFAGIALWAGALAAFLVLSPLWRRARDAARGVGAITLRSALPAVGLGALQGAIAGVALPIALGYDLGRGAAFFGLALLAGVAFSLIVQGLSALLGGFGRFVAFALLVVAFAVGIVSTVPGPLAAVGDASPVGAALSGFQAVATESAGVGGAAILLALWAAAGLALTALAVARVRRTR